MTLTKGTSLLFLLMSLFGCASQLQRPDTSQTIAEKEREQIGRVGSTKHT